jgi:hemoglobin
MPKPPNRRPIADKASFGGPACMLLLPITPGAGPHRNREHDMEATNATVTPYQRIGGEDAIRKLVGRFYQLMDELPEAYTARKIHPKDLTEAGDKFVAFLSGWLGGPQLYVEKYGAPMLRRRHMPYAIGPEERDQWLMCMRLALDELVTDVELREALYGHFVKLGEFVRNQGGNIQACGCGH